MFSSREHVVTILLHRGEGGQCFGLCRGHLAKLCQHFVAVGFQCIQSIQRFSLRCGQGSDFLG